MNVFAKERQEIQTGYTDVKDAGYELRVMRVTDVQNV